MSKKYKKRKVKKSSSRNNTPSFLGIGNSPRYLGGKSKINFLNSKRKPLVRNKIKSPFNNSKPLFKKNSKRIPTSFLTKTKVIPKQKYVNWNYKQIKKKFPGINPYGDADMDGSMNYKDCKPFDASRDGFFARALSIVTGGRKGQSKEDYAQEKSRKKEFKVETNKEQIKKERFLKEVGKKVKAIRKKQTLKEVSETGAGVRALSRKVLYKKVAIKDKKTGKVIGYKKALRGGQAVSTKVLKAAALAGLPVKIPKGKGTSKSGKTYATAGRPKGPSGKYQIPGKGPVYEHEYKKWLTKQRALARIQAEQAAGIPQQDISEAPQELEAPEEYGEYVSEEVEQPQPTQLTPQQIQQLKQIQLARQQQAQQVQRQPQRVSSQTAGGPVQDHILNAPSIARGELSQSQSGKSIPTVHLSERPQTNPSGEYYTNIDPMTGKQIMQRRVSEKFATGEAL